MSGEINPTNLEKLQEVINYWEFDAVWCDIEDPNPLRYSETIKLVTSLKAPLIVIKDFRGTASKTLE